jgi:ABC-type multidrug transport system permease subunit
MSGFFYRFFSSDAAQTYTIIFVFAVIAISLVYAFFRKRRKGASENC